MKATAFVAAYLCGAALLVGSGSVLAKDKSSAGYYQPKAMDGEAVARPAGCGGDGKRVDSLSRDLGQGVSVTVIPTSGAKRVSVNVLFKYWEKDGLKLAPEKFQLRAFSNDQSISAARMHRAAPTMDAGGVFLEEVYLEFPVRPGEGDHIAILLPDGTVGGLDGALKVAPFAFDKSAKAGKSPIAPCIYSAEPPARLNIAQLKAVALSAPVKGLKEDQLKGAWVADAAATESNLKTAVSLPADQFGMMAGTAMMMFAMVYEIGEDSIKVRLYDSGTKAVYRLAAGQKDSSRRIYKLEKSQGAGDDILTVVAAGQKSIKFVSQDPATNYVAFKRVQLDPRNGQRDKMAAVQSVQEMFARLQANSQ